MSKATNTRLSSPDRYDKANAVKLAEEEALVRQASRGNSTAFTKLYEYYIDLIYRYIYLRVGNISEAEALTNETFTRALEGLLHGRYTWRGKPFGAWLYGIAMNVLQEDNRGSMRASMTERLDYLAEHSDPLDEQPDPLDSFLQKEEQSVLWQLIKELLMEEQRILVFRHVYELSYAEIAERLGRSENACKQLHYRVLKKLRLKAQEVELWTEVTKGTFRGTQDRI